ncbi:MAG: hypothetical protein GX629_08325 [Phycisphaerae bacterium]|jgi:hypothetical protein|nr:hypothetical protein [Phycisphaerae bacterium]
MIAEEKDINLYDDLNQEDEMKTSYGSVQKFYAPTLLAAIMGRPCPHQKLSNDIELLKKTSTLLNETIRENILTQEEANAIIKFMTEKFVERRFDHILSNILDTETQDEYNFRAVGGLCTWKKK